MSLPARLPAWLTLLVWAVSALWEPLTPARAMLVVACLEFAACLQAGANSNREGSISWQSVFRHLPALLLLHALRPDAALWLAMALALALNLILAFPHSIRRRVAWVAVLLLCLPPLFQTTLRLAQRDSPQALAQMSLWQHAGVAEAAASDGALPRWWFRAPAHLNPLLLELEATRPRGLVLLFVLLAFHGLGLARRRPAYRSLAALLLLGFVPSQPGPIDLHLYPASAESRMAKTCTARETPEGVAIGSSRSLSYENVQVNKVVAWLERSPLHAPQSAGIPQDIELLQYWASGDDLPEGLGSRWELLADK
ncbi:MAG: hypothetical protein HOM77_03390, partial [Planctomycetes bacterium]|nr:hypothetical protein [Planctomycetota bacterium]